jgi:hypothetical protein
MRKSKQNYTTLSQSGRSLREEIQEIYFPLAKPLRSSASNFIKCGAGPAPPPRAYFRNSSGSLEIFAAIPPRLSKKLVGHHCQWIAGTCY